ncbi:MBL fold metallo-hydrolase [Endozoicomonas sp. OPT23]|uniref:MBL fold metallo-hydrolase n=1 Tax=Endozoicomonas sp. OPT23 TaxID=2072845 RepID=UPI00129B5826|nr:MBL fold metallo-hydrolase [Endozoicomonas sp. OPT23]MRI33446.1 MBL fold metallo-hydrolase [Endozoicomonas sp. OPT23]
MADFGRIQFEGIEGIRTGWKDHVTASFVNYRIGDTLIDCGPLRQWQFVRPFIAEKDVRQLLITHFHEDHTGNIKNIHDEFDVLASGHERTVRQLKKGFSITLLEKIFWGSTPKIAIQPFPERIELDDGSQIIPIHVPGHCHDMQCFFVPEKGYMFTGDLYIASAVKFLHEKENLGQQIDDIRNVLNYDFQTMFCPHRGVVEDGKQALSRKLEYLVELCGNAQHLFGQGMTVKEVTNQLLGPDSLGAYLTRFNFSKRGLIKGCLDVQL